MSYAYHRIIRKIVIAFGNIFNNISIARYDANGVEQEHFLVPILYGGKEKYVSRLEGDPNLDKKVQVTLPIMSFEMTDMSYDASRKLNTNQKLTHSGGAQNSTLAVYNPVPFNFDFELYAYVRNIEDGAQLMEKILPYFTPDYTVSVNLIPEMGIVKQIPLILNDVSHEIDYEGDYNSKVRSVIWTLRFTVKGYLYGPVTQPKIIRTSITNILDDKNLEEKEVLLEVNNGFGNYLPGEIIYQGYSYETATSTAKVYDWSASSNTLTLSDLSGHFITGANVIGLQTHATWNANNYTIPSGKMVTITVTPNPNDVILPNNYTYTTVITENISTSEVESLASFDSTIYDMSQMGKTMDDDFYTFDTLAYNMSITNVTMDTN